MSELIPILTLNQCKHNIPLSKHCQECCEELSKLNKRREKSQKFFNKFYTKGG